MDVFCADIGSVSGGNFGWSGRLASGAVVDGEDIRALAETVAKQLNRGHGVALGFEAPMFVPYRSAPADLTKRRIGETNPNWIGGPGSSVLATGLAQVPWALRDIRSKLTAQVLPTFSWDEFASGKAKFFLWEAFVSGGQRARAISTTHESLWNASEPLSPILGVKTPSTNQRSCRCSARRC